MDRVFIALGSNVGDRHAHLAAATATLAATGVIRVIRIADAIETDPVGCPDGSPRFLNSAAEVSTALPPLRLLRWLQNVEADLGRERSGVNGPRTIDLDLLLYGTNVIQQPPELIVPHPRMHQRRFVLQPLAAIAPDVVHPVLGKTIAQLLAGLD